MGDSTLSGPYGRPGTLIHEQDDFPETAGALPYRGVELAASLLRKIFGRLPFSFAVRLWSGPTFAVGGAAAVPSDSRFAFWFRTPGAVTELVVGRDPLRLAEAYFRSDVDIEGDLFAALRLKDHLQELRLPLAERLSALFMARKLQRLNRQSSREASNSTVHGPQVRGHSRQENRDAIHFHYDVSNDFYRLWLGRWMVYSCAYFEEAEYALDDAQEAKLEHICRKLLLKPGDRLLDIGCGWGALVIHAARHHGVNAHGVTLSEKQLQVAQRRIAEQGLEDRVTVELKDYRDLERREAYDKIASVGMFEHVGLKHLPLYFDTVHRLLKPDGLFLNHGITHEQPGWDKNLSTEFINRYVFPDGQLDNISNIQRFMEEAKFEIADVEALRAHYAMTLRHWVGRLERSHPRALEYVSEATYRVWRLYMSACALEFESGHLGLYQVLAAKRGPHSASLPLTRRHLYARPAKESAVAH